MISWKLAARERGKARRLHAEASPGQLLHCTPVSCVAEAKRKDVCRVPAGGIAGAALVHW